ncbi:Monosaccharide ABC transporter substrate-binding protein, CUT2 family [Microbacterium sp. C448]|uniref:sugar ABC transporter substrate-binding protein n=1 Tax=Microbacterium TaxID=33882 RepID=UPI0003DE6432|nr:MULTISPECIES: substrate-binding domain-containing protein [Microbacterium]MDO8382947.1 substrate-binding domain-containing protein [Microbacterium sp.]CDJ99026.1 Monosaccharide ABC transporter substrate-binding protein, CUT2 family [Microbacterium sp. C448]|tara:strand:+ start:1606 stop:2682 length:1077 start_codon:yes stop_codon:yes gene_type:complete
MKKSLLLPALAVVGASAVLLAGCSGSGTPSASEGGGGDAAGRACVILPDAASSPRWENFDRKYLQEGLEAAGFDVDIQNAQGDVNKYSTIADQQLTQGCGVMLLVDYQGAAEAVATKAKAEGIPVIAYDRPFTGADYYVSFDNVEVGRLEGQTVLDGLEAAGKDPATSVVVYMGGDPTDGNAAMFKEGAAEVMEAAGIEPAAEPPGIWDQAKSQTNFEQALTSLGGVVDGVWAANDTNAAGVIKVLQDNNLTGVAVSGQDANVAGLQNILLGWQTATVYKPVKDEADAAVEVAVALLSGEEPSADAELDDGTPYIQVTPILVGPDSVNDVIAAGDAAYDDVCTPDVMAACEEFGVTAP